ncbi:cytochrome P450 [Astrocystis sublimbata]|nr:cytochrome P450 [Astrocystis sublimbata]
MTDYNIPITISYILTFITLTYLLITRVFTPLRSVPGPFLARFTDLWYLWHVVRGHWEARNIELHRRYGILDGSDQALHAIYGPGSKFAKSSWYTAWAPPGKAIPNLFADRSIPRHAATRRQLQSTYSMTSLVSYEPYVDACVDLLVLRLREMSTNNLSGDFPDMSHWLQCYALDVIAQITYGKRLGSLDHSSGDPESESGKATQEIQKAIESQLLYGVVVGVYVQFHRVAFALLKFFRGDLAAGRARVAGLARTGIEEMREKRRNDKRQGAPANQPPFTRIFLTQYYNKQPLTPSTQLSGLATNISAGSDTTGITLCAILYQLLQHPACMSKLRDEITSFQASELFSDPARISFKESQQMPYLQAVIKEAMRVHPAGGLPMERVVPAGGAVLCGRFFPSGTIVGVNTWVTHRNTEIFGADADDFRPERWLIEDAEKLAAMNRQWIPFGLGSRTCIGRHISTLEISKLIPRLVRDFDFDFHLHLDLADNQQQQQWDTRAWWFVKPREFKVWVSEVK